MWGSGLNIAPLGLPKDMKGMPMQTAVGAQHFIYLTDVGEVWTWYGLPYAFCVGTAMCVCVCYAHFVIYMSVIPFVVALMKMM